MKTPLIIAFLLGLALPPLAAESPPAAPAAPPPPPPGFEASPAAVRAAILKAAGSGRVEKVRAVRRGEQTLYLADIDLVGDYDLKLQLLASGEIVRRTDELPVDAMPAPVRQTMASLAGKSGIIDEVKKVTEGGKTHFKAEIDRPGLPELDVKVAPDGTLLEQKEDKD